MRMSATSERKAEQEGKGMHIPGKFGEERPTSF